MNDYKEKIKIDSLDVNQIEKIDNIDEIKHVNNKVDQGIGDDGPIDSKFKMSNEDEFNWFINI